MTEILSDPTRTITPPPQTEAMCESCAAYVATQTINAPGKPDPDLASIDVPFRVCDRCAGRDVDWAGTIEIADRRSLRASVLTIVTIAGSLVAYVWLVNVPGIS